MRKNKQFKYKIKHQQNRAVGEKLQLVPGNKHDENDNKTKTTAKMYNNNHKYNDDDHHHNNKTEQQSQQQTPTAITTQCMQKSCSEL